MVAVDAAVYSFLRRTELILRTLDLFVSIAAAESSETIPHDYMKRIAGLTL
jgi:hypothetical protein